MPNRSPAASAAGTTAQPGCDSDGACESSVSSDCASTPLASAASIGPHTTFEHTTVATFSPPYARANSIAARPGGSSAPETIAATVSSTCCFTASTTVSGKARARASLMYPLSFAITGLTVSVSAASAGQGRHAAATIAQPACISTLRRLNFAPF